MSDELVVHDSCGNVFEDMGMPDADERLAKALRAREIRVAMDEHDLTRMQAERLPGDHPPDAAEQG